jgi:hypothetical protein
MDPEAHLQGMSMCLDRLSLFKHHGNLFMALYKHGQPFEPHILDSWFLWCSNRTKRAS